ncbi:unnamed protein product [Arabis nemorensis]|uniref:Uncharacterized protein n=1 Tax=Arabis nemorensis TaxID=586526 RepID=A0A565B4B6_9BRAS|nr:unnamed protein product [Arabis nemorensis]
MVDVEYAWLLSKCRRCGQFGHKIKCSLQGTCESHVVANKDIEIEATASIVVTTVASSTVPKSVDSNTISAHASRIEVSPNTLIDAVLRVQPSSTPVLVPITNVEAVSELVIASIDITIEETPTAQDSIIFVQHSVTNLSTTGEISLTPKSTTTASVTTTTLASATKITTIEVVPVWETHTPKPILPLVIENGVIEPWRSPCENGVFTGYESFDASSQRIRRGRPIKPTQKMQENQWTLVSGHSKRGRGDRGNRGPLH